MKKLITVLSLLAFCSSVAAAETVLEKAEAKTNNVKRGVKHLVHKADEKLCDKGKIECAGRKADHRVLEGADYVKDKAAQGANALDNEDKKD